MCGVDWVKLNGISIISISIIWISILIWFVYDMTITYGFLIVILFFAAILLLNFLLDYIPKTLWIKKCGQGKQYIYIEKNNIVLQVGTRCKKYIPTSISKRTYLLFY